MATQSGARRPPSVASGALPPQPQPQGPGSRAPLQPQGPGSRAPLQQPQGPGSRAPGEQPAGREHWGPGAPAMALLSERQGDSVAALQALAESRALPEQLPLEELTRLPSRPLQLPAPLAAPASLEEALSNGFRSLGMEHERIETAQQFFTWFSKVQDQINEDEDASYRRVRESLYGYGEQCDAMLRDVDLALQELQLLEQQYVLVSTKTGALHSACEELLMQQSKLVELAEDIQQKLSYFNDLENISTKLNNPNLAVTSEGFVATLVKLDDCISYISSHPGFKDFPTFLHKQQQCLSRALLLMRTSVVFTLQKLTATLSKRDATVPVTDDGFTLFYVKFRAAAPRVRSLIEQIEQRSEKSKEYQTCLADIHLCYLEQRDALLRPSISATIGEMTQHSVRDHCALVRSGCAFMVHVCQDEHRLFSEFFSRPSPRLDELLERLCLLFYDAFRPLIIHVMHLETLSELCSILKSEMLDDHYHNNREELAAFAIIVRQMLGDVQERLVYRTHIYIQTDILGYRPAPGDLAYPDKLHMMEQIAQSLQEESAAGGRPQPPSFSEVALEDAARRSSVPAAGSVLKASVPVSPADLHGMWFPTVRRTLLCLSKLHRCMEKPVFQGLSQEALSACIKSLLSASEAITKKKTVTDGQLFLIKHLLILREQIAPFHADFTIKEVSLDMRKTKEAAYKMLTPRTVPKLFRLNSHNAILEFILQGTPEVKEHFMDSKKDVDRQLKATCEQFIQQQSSQLVGPLKDLVAKVAALKAMASQGGPKYSLHQQPWAKPEKIQEVVSSSYRALKSRVPSVQRSMALYLANGDTEAILFKPIKNNVQQAFEHLQAVLAEDFSEEDLQIIACPSPEQVNLLLVLTK
ncbi:conserved oligomeric Golgi complex subunit 3 isoform X2 [Lethenteron reissneri]|uniref:conserved oligomeric Golgi complex subunit 3 isoform X2 n=1 Tax=Lethenteron reissneri TaxID=7753 RepID=UPI002AB5EA7E|nr:conserved oligomeric Golgi complex subunit 3 isoform X2 [Lethenteron reissneri]